MTGETFAELAARDAGLGVGHVWTAVHCPAYDSLNPAECTCNGPSYAERFTQAYAVAMLWANVTEIGETGETSGDSVDPYAWQTPSRTWAIEAFDDDARAEIRQDCEAFVQANWDDLKLAASGARFRGHEYGPEQAGHDFALTRNHHGAGFWDRGLGEIGDRLTADAHAYGESSGYLTTDENEVHIA